MYWSDHDGYTIFGSDIGGYRTDDSELGRPKDVLIRWAQLGALSAIMENGGAGEHRPWKFDEETATIYRQFTTLHHALIPYLMEEGGIAFAERRGLMSFTDKPTLSYQLGADLFVVPVLDETGTVTVRFPDGRWVYAFDPEQVFEGEVETSFTVPLSQYPLFFRDEAEVGATVLTALEVSP
jgi:alpha-D-xyloside xylohydrolase